MQLSLNVLTPGELGLASPSELSLVEHQSMCIYTTLGTSCC